MTIVVRRLQNQQSPGLITFKHPVPSIFQRNSGGEAKIFTSIKKNLTVFDKLFIEIILLGIESYILIMSRRFYGAARVLKSSGLIGVMLNLSPNRSFDLVIM